jgi:uncharacterized membrane protein
MPHEVIVATGICELAGAAALLTGRFRGAAGIALAAYAICVYPANVKHAVDSLSGPGVPQLGWWYHVPRLAFQPVMVWWGLFAGGVVQWPFGRHPSAAGRFPRLRGHAGKGMTTDQIIAQTRGED